MIRVVLVPAQKTSLQELGKYAIVLLSTVFRRSSAMTQVNDQETSGFQDKNIVRLFWMMVSSLLVIGIAVGGTAITSMVKLSNVQVTQTAQNEQIAEIKAQIATLVADRYTVSEASRDRAQLLEMLKDQISKNTRQDEQITSLLMFKAVAESQSRKTTP